MIERFDRATAEFLGQGWESLVYALDAGHVVRIYKHDTSLAYIEQCHRFYRLLQRQCPPFAIPQIFESGTLDGQTYMVESRMPGEDFSTVLPMLTGRERERALVNYLHAAEQIGTVRFPTHWFGELIVPNEPIQRVTWPHFLWDRMQLALRRSLGHLQQDIPQLDATLETFQVLLRHVVRVEAKCLVHGAYSPANVRIDDDLTICGIGGFGPMSVIGDPRMDLAGAVAFLELLSSYHPDDTSLLLDRLIARHGTPINDILQLYRLYYSMCLAPCKADAPTIYHWCVQNLQTAQLQAARNA